MSLPGKLNLFKKYTQNNCIYECELKIAYDKCHCIPWDYPHFDGFMPICDRFGRECFKKYMAVTNSEENCDCPVDCVTTNYDYSVSSTLIDAESLCDNNEIEDFWDQGLFPTKFVGIYEQIVYGKDIGTATKCIENTKKIAIVKFQIASKIITRIKRTQYVTFAGTLSNIGK